MSLRSKFLAWITSLLTLVVIGIGAMSIFSEARLINDEMKRHQDLTVQRLAKVCEESLYQSEVVLLNYFETLKAERGFLGASFLDLEGKVQAQSTPKVPFQEENAALKLEAPVMFGDSRVGTARLLLSKDIIDTHIRELLLVTAKRVFVILGIAFFIGIIGAFVLTNTMVTPIQQIVAGMKEVSKGHLDPLPLPKRRDELGWLGMEINSTIGKLRDLDEMKRNFFSRVTHDLRSPLIGIQGLVSLLLKEEFGSLTNPSKEALVDVRNFTARLTSLIDDLLTTSKLEAGHDIADLTDFNIVEVIDEVSKIYLPLAHEKGVRLVKDFPLAQIFVHADREKVGHVLTNLISNAYKFTRSGTVTLGIQVLRDRVSVSVADTGFGIPESERQKIFDKFYRVQATKKVKGTGLGLYIVKSLLELQNGTIEVTENKGGGAKFVFTLPAPSTNHSPQNGSPLPLNS